MNRLVSILCMLVLSLGCFAQKIAVSQLTNRKWKLVKPLFSYCDKAMTFSNTEVTNISNYHFVKRGDNKVTKKSFTNSFPFYLAETIPSKFNQNQVGKNSSGIYIVKNVNNRLIAFKILSLRNCELKLLTPEGDIFIYDETF